MATSLRGHIRQFSIFACVSQFTQIIQDVCTITSNSNFPQDIKPFLCAVFKSQKTPPQTTLIKIGRKKGKMRKGGRERGRKGGTRFQTS